MRLEGVELDRFRRDRLEARASAGRVTLDRARGHVEGTGVVVERFGAAGPAGKPGARLEAGTATTTLRGDEVTFAGGVRLLDASGRLVETAALTHQGATDRLRSGGPVRVSGANFVASGRRLVGALREGRLEVEGPVTATVAPRRASPR